MSIPAVQARPLFTKALVAQFKQLPVQTQFLSTFFPVVEKSTKELAIQIQRYKEKVAKDVERGTNGNRNQATKSTEKIFLPPLFKEYFDVTELHLYDRLFGATGNIDSALFNDLRDEAATELMELRKKIERAIELQCAQVLEDGIVTLNSGENIDFKRKADSMVDLGAGNYWTSAVNPIEDIEAGCQFLRQVGKAQGNVFNMILGTDAKAALYDNTDLKETANLRRIDNVDLRMPQRNQVGGTSHGQISAGDYTVRIWTYPEYYDNDSDVSTAYMNSKKVVLIPENPKFIRGFAAVPQLIDEATTTTKGAFLVQEYKDRRKKTIDYEISSAPLAIPVAVDQIYTAQVVA